MENNGNKLKIKDWAEEDRPREKFLTKGLVSLSDAELIAILLRNGSRQDSALDLAKKVLNIVKNNLNLLGRLDVHDLMDLYGIGEAKAISILAAFELGRRRNVADAIARTKIISSVDIFRLFQPILSDIKHEELWLLLLDRSNKVNSIKRITQGGLYSTIVDIKLILKMALEKLATSIVLCHNHPSGNTFPSDEDIKITRKVKEAALVMDMQLLDHVIIAEDKYFSFADSDKL